MVKIEKEKLQGIKDRESLFAFLQDVLRWPLDPSDTFTYDIQVSDKTATKADVSRIVPFATEDPFAIMLVEFKEEMRRPYLREILREIRAKIRKQAAFEGKGLEEIVFVCVTKEYQGIRFAHFTEREGKQPKLSVFGWDRDSVEETRTLREFNLPALEMPRVDLFDQPDWGESYKRWMEAWNVQSVTGEFYRQYKRLFEEAEAKITGIDDEEDKRLFTQKLFNRLLFIRFLEKKGWLSFNGRMDYLAALWEDYTAKRRVDQDFYTSRLKWLFFLGLNNETENDLMVVNDGGFLKDYIGDVPYLNGGLFDEAEDEKQNEDYPDIRVPDDAISPILTGLFYDYNFTVMESTPDDEDVAVDPEMLGIVFERLATDRHDTGSYYTPREIVSFMCREGLKGYLREELPNQSPDDIACFVDERYITKTFDSEAAYKVLERVKVCDPACGSGAYLLGMLHELMELRSVIFNRKGIGSPDAYKKKLWIIAENIYGVDLAQFAVNIARLRLWLSLMIEYELKQGERPQPLPNLDFKIEQGDSLTAPAPGGGDQLDLYRHGLVERYMGLKSDYLMAHGNEKKTLKYAVEGLKADIAKEDKERGKSIKGFDWDLEFTEVFEDKGFDIVLANPPYVMQERIKEQKPILKERYGDLYCGTADLLVYFYLRALEMLKPSGMLVFISSNKWFKADYGVNLRKHVASTCAIISITDFGSLPVFNAAAYPMIFIARKHGDKEPVCFTQVKSLDEPYPDVLAIIRECGQTLPEDAIKGADWVLTDFASAERLRKMKTGGNPLALYVKEQIYRGVLTGLNEAFVIDGAKRNELIAADSKSEEIIKPLVVGRDVHKWRIDHRDRWLIVTKIGVDMQRYPAVMAHLSRWKKQLDKRWDKGDQWWELRACAYYDAFDKPKIIYPQIMIEPSFAYDTSGLITNQKCFIIGNADLYLLGILNSQPVWEFLLHNSPGLRGGYAEPRKELLMSLSIPDASDADQKAISTLVQKCLDAKGIGCEEWEREIDERVAALYGL